MNGNFWGINPVIPLLVRRCTLYFYVITSCVGRVNAQLRQEFSNQVAIVTAAEHTAAIRFDGQPVSTIHWSTVRRWGVAYAAFSISHGAHYITVTERSRASFTAYAYGHSLVDTSSSAYGYAVGFEGMDVVGVSR